MGFYMLGISYTNTFLFWQLAKQWENIFWVAYNVQLVISETTLIIEKNYSRPLGIDNIN